MTMHQAYVRHGIGSVRPYIYGGIDVIEFIRQAFAAEVIERLAAGQNGYHVEFRIGDSMVVLEAGEFGERKSPSSIYVYVADVDATYERAIRAGAESVAKPEDKRYQERTAGVRDTFGNTWYIATYTGKQTASPPQP